MIKHKSKSVWVEAGRAKIWHKYALLVQTENCILRLRSSRNSVENFLKISENYLEKIPKIQLYQSE
jgi:hypothetical protein